MIIFGDDWWDDWMDRISRCYYILSWWWEHPSVHFRAWGMVVYGQARHIYDFGNTYNHGYNKYLDARLAREIPQFVFVATT